MYLYKKIFLYNLMRMHAHKVRINYFDGVFFIYGWNKQKVIENSVKYRKSQGISGGQKGLFCKNF